MRSTWLIVAVLLAAVLITHASALRGWWLWDDPQLVLHAERNSVGEILFSPTSYRTLASHTFTPLLSLSFKSDLRLAGFEPWLFYLHQLIVLSAATLLLFLLLRQFVSVIAAGMGALAFVLAPTTLLVARTLMTRHYLEGCVFALASLLIWIRVSDDVADSPPLTPPLSRRPSPRRGEGGFSWPGAVSALLYLLAMLAKEIYAPLPLLMIAVGRARGEKWSQLGRRLIPHAICAAVFLIWRGVMLESLGGYTDLPGVGAILRLPIAIGSELFRQTPLSIAIAAIASALLLAAGAIARGRGRALLTVLLMLIFVALPIAPLALRFEWRYTFLVSVVLVAALAIASEMSRFPRWLSLTLFGVFIVMSWAGGRAQLRRFEHDTAAMIAEGKYVWTRPAKGPILLASSPGWYLEGLTTLRASEGREPSPRFVLSVEPFVLGEVDAGLAVESHWGTAEITPMSVGTLASIAKHRGRFDPDVAMTLRFRCAKHALHWDLEPAATGTFTFLTYPYYGRYPIRAAGWNRIPDSGEAQAFRVRYDRGDGRWNISPVIPLPKEGESVRWSGPR